MQATWTLIYDRMMPQPRGARTGLSLTGAHTTGQTLEGEMKLNHNLTPLTKINLRWITELNEKGKTIKLLEDSIREYLQELSVKVSLDKTQKALTTKKWINLTTLKYLVIRHTLIRVKR